MLGPGVINHLLRRTFKRGCLGGTLVHSEHDVGFAFPGRRQHRRGTLKGKLVAVR